MARGRARLPARPRRSVTVRVYQSGLLADPRPGAPHGYRSVPRELGARVRAIRAVCDRHAVPPLAAALQFPLGHPAVVTVVVGARAPHEIAESAGLLAHPIPPAFWAELKALGLLPEEAPRP
ncbi:oxidoreductase [Streptomyces bingchenggensis BCW-1]|uniref:Oxidoreductase n=2 Tax=Streptomyces TaxID=1883 RepID=D7BTI6_STRBB|nr:MULTISPECIES: aldo/keto reductase [Streptomyces]ADI07425.1 oxidoreductase [Streptomyces bingchenggensis BCW-1]